MYNEQIFNQKGLTLIELLAALSLFSVVILISSTVMINALTSEAKVSDASTLQQETNFLINDLRKQYDDNETILCLVPNRQEISVHPDSAFLTVNEKGEQTELTVANGCISKADSQPINESALKVKLIVESAAGQSFAAESVFDKKEPLAVNINTEERFVINGTSELTRYINRNNNCDFPDNTEFRGKISFNLPITGLLNCFKIATPYTYTVEGKSWINSYTRIGLDGRRTLLHIEEDAIFEEGQAFTIEGLDTAIRIDGNAVFEQNFRLDNGGSNEFSIGGNAVFDKNLEINGIGNTVITIGGNAEFGGGFNIKSIGNTTINIKGDATFHEKIDIRYLGKTKINIGGTTSCTMTIKTSAERAICLQR